MTDMARRSSDREAIAAEIDRVRSLGLDQLRSLWRTTFRSSPPLAFAKDLTARGRVAATLVRIVEQKLYWQPG